MKRLVLSAFSMLAMIATAQLPYQNPDLSAKERAEDLCSRLTVEEKAKLMVNSSEAIPRLGIREFSWWNEALHGVARNGYSTVFPSCIGMASSFDDTLLYNIYTAVSDEGRAKHTAKHKNGPVKQYEGVSFWTPNINIFRDPRWGRGQETYGEDPYQTGRMGSIVVKGLQGEEGHKYRKAFACAKHFAVHSGPESTRHHLNLDNISPRDLWETYLPAFKTLVQKGGVKEVMCAYQRLDGDPCCGSNRLLTQILRNEWGFDGVVVSDCGAIRDFYQKGRHEVSADAPSAASKAVLSGTDVNCGKVYLNLPEAVEKGYIKEADIDVSVKRLLEGRFELGDFDPDELNDWTKIPESVVCSPEHKALALQMAREQMVLLQNKKNTLPLAKDERVILMGPNAADSVMLWGIYYGKPTHSVTVKEGLEKKLGSVPYYKACALTSFNEAASKNIRKVLEYGTDDFIPEVEAEKEVYSIESILNAAKDYTTVVFVGGISPLIEREEAKVDLPGFKGGDRTSIELPQVQRDILAALHKAGKKVIFVNCSGSAVALTPETKTCDAILQAWYPGEEGGNAVADILTGAVNPSGKLSVSYPRTESTDLYCYNNGEDEAFVAYPFGFGLSYSDFEYSDITVTPSVKTSDQWFDVSLNVTNNSDRDGDEVVELYASPAEGQPLKPIQLKGFKRISLKAGETKAVSFKLSPEQLAYFNVDAELWTITGGKYDIKVGRSSSDLPLCATVTLTGKDRTMAHKNVFLAE